MSKKKYYAVRIGFVPGIYDTWTECEKQVKGYPGAIYKSFCDKDEANAFLEGDKQIVHKKKNVNTPYAFVDGSYNITTGVYGYGGFLCADGEKYIVQGSGDDAEMASMRNVAGEVLGSMAAIALAIEKNIKKIEIYYDYLGIEMWATGEWKRNKKGTIAYYEYIQSVKDKIDVSFVKVKGHSGIEGNEEADRLAKEAVGISY